MKFKVDENLPMEIETMLRAAGHDAMSVPAQGLAGKPDQIVAGICHDEQRAILTLDLDFADIRRFPPADYPGIIVLRLASQDRSTVLSALERVLPFLQTEALSGKLWIVDENSLRIRE